MPHTKPLAEIATELSKMIDLKGGSTECPSLQKLMADATADPVLWHPVSESVKEKCADRARLVAFLMTGAEDWLTDADRMFLMEADGVLVDSFALLPRLLKASLSLSRNALLEMIDFELCSKAEQLWIKELAMQYGTFTAKELSEAEELTAEFFGDGEPFTMARFFAAERALEDHGGMELPQRN